MFSDTKDVINLLEQAIQKLKEPDKDSSTRFLFCGIKSTGFSTVDQILEIYLIPTNKDFQQTGPHFCAAIRADVDIEYLKALVKAPFPSDLWDAVEKGLSYAEVDEMLLRFVKETKIVAPVQFAGYLSVSNLSLTRAFPRFMQNVSNSFLDIETLLFLVNPPHGFCIPDNDWRAETIATAALQTARLLKNP